MATAPLRSPAIGVVICAYTLDRWPDLQRAVGSVLSQKPSAGEVVVVVDHNAALLQRAKARWTGAEDPKTERESTAPTVRVVANQGAQGLSGARNSGVDACYSDVVAFLDDDAEADEGWLASLLGPYADPQVAACGGPAVAALVGTRPPWWPVEFDWVVGCSYLGLPTRRSTVRNLIGANMSIRRTMVLELGGFPEGIGRVGSHPSGCEETDLFIRLVRRWPESRILYEPTAGVRHTVPAARLSWRYFRARCFAEGLSKASVAARVGSGQALSSERSYTLKVLPQGIARSLLDAWRGENGAARRALAITAGLCMTMAGYVWGQLGLRVGGTVQQSVP
ncbi:MAG: glycosyltransferase family 2 protein [Acidimicrobiales bacterium]